MSPEIPLPASYSDALGYLLQARKFGLKLGLETMGKLLGLLGHPEASGHFIHIAGTNGKGSTAAFCAAILRERGVRVGLFTSPHLCSIRERIQISGEKISREDFARGLGMIREVAEKEKLNPTFFEILTTLALWYFARQRVEWVVWETGLGGRLDATNIVTPRVCIISNIALDHTEILGTSRAAIAAEKAGIIKPGVPVVTAVQDAESLSVIEKVAAERGSPLVRMGRDCPVEILAPGLNGVEVRIDGKIYSLGLRGPHQAWNAACAVGALRTILIEGQPLADQVLENGLAKATWPGRFQILRTEPLLVVDGAHNLDAAEALVQAWQMSYGDQQYHLVFGALSDKPYAAMATILHRQAARVTLVGVPSERSADPQLLASHFSGLPLKLSPSLTEIWPELWSEKGAVLIAGSLFLVGHALTLACPQEYAAEDLMMNERLR